MGNYFIGIMTGTSADSLDGCLVSFEKNFKFVESITAELEGNYKSRYEDAIRAGYKKTSESKDLLLLEKSLNEKTIQLIKELIKKTKIDFSEISSIGFSGQTVFHTNKMSFQIGDPKLIARETNIDVYSDFRNYDIKNGGLGAPLIPVFHKYIYSEKNSNKLVFNIGGIANGTYLQNEKVSLASDVGPGNCLIDYFMKKNFGQPFDNLGKKAMKGEIDTNLLQRLLSECADMKYPRADDKKVYYNLIDNSFDKVDPNSLLRTLTEFTATKIIEFYKFCEKPNDVIFHGGGTKNLFLMNIIKNEIGKVRTTDGEIPSKYVEAAAFAYLAYLKKGELYLSK